MMMVENKNTRFKSALLGVDDMVYSFAIGTPENPMGKKLTKEENARRRTEFEDYLKKNKYKYFMIKEKYGNVENSYMILNVNETDMKEIFGYENFDQESFIYAEKVWIDSKNDTGMQYIYFEKNKGDSPFVAKDISETIQNQSEAEDFFSSLKNYKFSIDFDIFKETLQKANQYLYDNYKWKLEEFINDTIEYVYEKLEDTSKSRYSARCFLYETKEKYDQRQKRLSERKTLGDWQKVRENLKNRI